MALVAAPAGAPACPVNARPVQQLDSMSLDADRPGHRGGGSAPSLVDHGRAPHTPHTPPGPGGPPGWVAGLPLATLVLGLALAYAGAALLSLALSRQPGSVAGIWYANALAAAVLAHRPLRHWPALLAGVAVAIVLANGLWGDALLVTLSFVPANLAEVALAGAALRWAGLHRAGLATVGELSRALLLGGLLPALAGATLAVATVQLDSGSGFVNVWLPWVEGVVIASLSVLPLALRVAHAGPQLLLGLMRQLRWWALGCAAVGVPLVAASSLPYPMVFVSLPLLLAAVLLRAEGAYSLTLVVSITLAAALDLGVLVPPPLSAAWQQVFVYTAIAAALLPGQLLAATLHELHDSRERLSQRTELLRRTNEGLQQFVHVASHDLREPLNTIAAFGGLLQQDVGAGLPAASQQHLGLMLQGTQRMRTLLDDLLQFVRVQQSPLAQAQAVDLDALWAQVQQSLAQQLASTGARVDSGALGVVTGHPALLQLLLQNLLSNAVKFVAPGQVPQVRLQAREEAGHRVLELLDNGIGVDPEQAARLFQPFVRLHPRRRYEGTGLGLALARQIAELHGGRIAVSARPEGGSCFAVWLPRA